MDLSGILSIGGYPGLFKMVSQMKTGLVVESLLDGKRMPAYSTQKILALEDISIYTDEDDVPLADVFSLLFKKTAGKAGPNHKKVSIQELSDYLASVLPNYDKERVYNSDLKKLFQWFNLLAEKGLLKEKEEEKKEVKAKKPAKKKEAAKEEKPKPKSAPKGKKGSTKKVIK
ncbi:MAG TPA: hypothetical protein DCR04_03215 [Flavobacteriales bacterium]|nr:hypothetical protein [Flavobacteriales bacterium]